MTWFFVRVPGCGSEKGVKTFRKDLRKAGRVYLSQFGTSMDPTAGWYVLSAPGGVNELRGELEKLGISKRVDLIESMTHRAHGPTFARQMALFS